MHRSTIFLLLLILTAMLITGCTFSLGKQKFMLRPGFRVPSRSVEKGDGEKVTWEELDPNGNTVFVFVRGEL